MSKIKGKNIKEMILGHGEKVVLGCAVLFVLTTVVSARWGTYQKQPIEFDQAVKTQDGAFVSSVFPPEERAKLDAPYSDELVKYVFEGNTGNYEYSTKWVSPIYKPKEKRKEPTYTPVEDLIADAGKVLLELSPEVPNDPQIAVKVEDDTATASPESTTPALPGIAGPRVEGPRAARGAVGPGGALGTTTTSPGDEGYGVGGEYPGGEGYGQGGEYPGAGYPGAGLAGGRMASRNVEARGARFVAVRGVLPYKSLIQSYKKALNAETTQEAAQQIQLWDIEIQRKTALPGAADEWSGNWEDVDLEVALNILNRTQFDLSIISDEYRDVVLTMQLPYRATGSWDSATSFDGQRLLASHPRIKRLLTEKEKEEQETRAAALIRAAEEAKTLKSEQRGGFSRVQYDTRSLQTTMGGNSAMRESFGEHYSSMMGMTGEGAGEDPNYATGGYNPYTNSGAMGAGGAFNRMTVVATPDLLLFRLFDFSVVPGNKYLYRVRVQVKNPNYDRDIAELADSAFREGEFRYTPWSEMSNPAAVQDETEMFLARADDRRGVDLDVYQWMAETGTYVKGPFKKLQRGDRVAAIGTEDSRGNMIGQLETDVLRPVNMTFATEKIDYVTSNTLVDFQHLAAMSPEDHPDLDLGGRRLKIARDEALTMNQFGELVALDTSSQDARYKAIEARQQQQEQLWSHLKNAAGPAGAAGGIDGLLEGYGAGEDSGFPPGYGSGGEYPGSDYGSGGEYPGGGGEYPGGGSSRRRRRSSLKRGGMGMGGYGSGGGYPGGEF